MSGRRVIGIPQRKGSEPQVLSPKSVYVKAPSVDPLVTPRKLDDLFRRAKSASSSCPAEKEAKKDDENPTPKTSSIAIPKWVYWTVFWALVVLAIVLIARFNYAEMHAPKHSFEMEVNATCTRYPGVLLDNPNEYPECHRASAFLRKSVTWWCVEKLFYDYLGSYICAAIDGVHTSIVNYFYTSAGIEMAKAAAPHAAVGIGKGFVDGIMKWFGFGAKAKLA